MPPDEQQRLFRLPIDELYIVATWLPDSGWRFSVRARPEGGSWRDDGHREEYDHLSTEEFVSTLPDSIERLRGF